MKYKLLTTLLVVSILVTTIHAASASFGSGHHHLKPSKRLNAFGEDACAGVPDGMFVNDATRCTAFWRCVEGEAFPGDCPDGFSFNEDAQSCDEEHDCVDPVPEPPTLDVCDGVANGTFVNNPINCQAYWLCLDGRTYCGNCENGFNFNEKEQVCDHPENYFCENEPEFECPESGIHSFPLDRNCTAFHFCFAGEHAILSCAEGLHFDEVLLKCNFPEQARCTRDRCPLENDINNIVTWPSEEDCGEFYICFDQELQPYRCAPGLHWNQAIQRCDFIENANCTIETTTTEPPTDPPTVAPTDPPTDAPTDPPTDAPTEPPVDPPTEPPVDPPTEPPVDPPTEPPVDPPTEPPVDPPTEPPVDPPTEPPVDPPTEPPVEPPTDPPEGFIGNSNRSFLNCPKNTFNKFILQPHPTSCNLYYLCINGEYRLESCAHGLNFDPSLGQCNFPHKFKCIV